MGLTRMVLPVENTRGGIAKKDMIHNDATPHIEVDPETYEVRVVAAAETLAEITAEPALLIRLAWYLGNRHLDVSFHGAALRICADHVIEAMAAGLGGAVRRIEAPFDPEPGAYTHHG
ncbi:MAG: urease accessory protein UreE C-terminal domain-containing protein [Acidiphilium sp.]